MSRDVATFLRATAQVIKTQGWDTGSWSTTGPVCVEGAMLVVIGDNFVDNVQSHRMIHHLRSHPAYRYLKEYLKLPWSAELYEWNDRQASEEPVLYALEQAARAWERKRGAQFKKQIVIEPWLDDLATSTCGTKPVTDLEYSVVDCTTAEKSVEVPDYVPESWTKKVMAKLHLV